MTTMDNKRLYDDIYASSNIIAGDEYKTLVCAIAKVASDMVCHTLGPYGSTTVIDDGSGFTYPSKDGWSCLNKLQFTDPTYNTIYMMLKKVSFNSVTTVGDGTTTAMVTANHFLETLYSSVYAKLQYSEDGNTKVPFRQADFIASMDKICDLATKMLQENPNIQKIDMTGDFSDIYKIAHIATNGNHEFSEIIQKIYQETGNPNIHVGIDAVPDTTYEIQSGYKFDSRVLNYPAYVNMGNGTIEYVNSPRKVVVFNHSINFQTHQVIIASLSAMASRDNCEIVIMAPYFDDLVSAWIDSSVQKMVQAGQLPNIMLVQLPMTMELHRLSIGDLAVLMNAQVFDDAKVKAFNLLYHNQTHPDNQIEDQEVTEILTLEKETFESPEDVLTRCLGTAKTLIFNKHEGFLRDYEDIANAQYYNAIIEDATTEYEEAKIKANKLIGGTLDKDFLFKQMRYIKLKGKTGVITVGALSDIQQRCDKDTIDDAVLACRSAFEHGFVRGMNIELLRVLSKLGEEYTDRYDMAVIGTLMSAFSRTTLMVMKNKHSDHSAIRNINVAVPNEVVDVLVGEEDGTATLYGSTTFCNISALQYLVDEEKYFFDYNLTTETMNPKGSWEVINSTATDIEILRAVVNVLTTIMTSSQFISTTRRFDEKRINANAIGRKIEDEKKLAEARIAGTMAGLKDFREMKSFMKDTIAMFKED